MIINFILFAVIVFIIILSRINRVPKEHFKGCLFINNEAQHDLGSPKTKHPNATKSANIPFINTVTHNKPVFKQARKIFYSFKD